MAAGAWTFYNAAKKHLMDGTIDLDGATPFKMSLHTSASNAAITTLSTIAAINNQVANANGYVTGGATLAAVTWGTGASATEYRFDSTAVVWTAAGGAISAVKYAVISQGTLALCFSQLSTVQFSVTSGNSLTVTPSANGYFELN